MRTFKDITETIGHRLTGSDNGRRQEEYAYRLFQQYGYKMSFSRI